MAKREDLALVAAQKWLDLEPNSLDAREQITQLALRAGLEDTVFAQCEAIVKDHPGGTDDGFRHVSLLLAQVPEKAEIALRVMRRLVAEWPQRGSALRAESLLALRLGDIATAEGTARESLKLEPKSQEGTLLLVAALVKKDAVAEADGIVDGLARDSKSAADLRLGYARMLLESDRRQPAHVQLEDVLKLRPNDAEARIALGLLALDERQLAEAEKQFKAVAELPSPEARSNAAYYLGRIAEARSQPQAAIAEYQKVNSGNQAIDASARRAALLGKSGQIDAARELFAQLREQYPPLTPRLTMAEGQMLVDANLNEDALKLYNDALDDNPDDPDLLYARSLAYEKLGQVGNAEADLRHLLAETPDDPRGLNALGYMLLVHDNSRVEEARTLVARAYEMEPNDPAIIDSMAWADFKSNRATEALGLLRKAYEAYPDPEVAAHLGEVLWSLGQKDEARRIFSGAQKADGDNAVLNETVKRLTK